MAFTDLVFPHGVPSAKTLAKDLVACGIPVTDSRGWRVDFHALRHTFASLLAHAGVSEAVRVKLTRHSEWKQTDHYTDPQSLPLFAEMAKMSAQSLAPILAPKFGKTGQNEGKPVPSDTPKEAAEIVAIDEGRTELDHAVPDLDRCTAGGERGIRTHGTLPSNSPRPPASTHASWAARGSSGRAAVRPVGE